LPQLRRDALNGLSLGALLVNLNAVADRSSSSLLLVSGDAAGIRSVKLSSF